MGPSRLELSKPVIAAIEGHAVAGGLELAIWCDLRVSATDASFGVYCRRWGVPLIDGGTVRLPALIGMGRAMDLVLSGREVDATEALSIGLVNRLAALGGIPGHGTGLGRRASPGCPRSACATDRRAMLAAWGVADTDEALALELEQGRVALTEVAAGLERFRGGAGRHGEPISGPRAGVDRG